MFPLVPATAMPKSALEAVTSPRVIEAGTNALQLVVIKLGLFTSKAPSAVGQI